MADLKFKIGDRVKASWECSGKGWFFTAGDVGTINRIDHQGGAIYPDRPYLVIFDARGPREARLGDVHLDLIYRFVTETNPVKEIDWFAVNKEFST